MQQHAAHPVTQQHINLAHWQLNHFGTACYNCYFAAEAVGGYDLARQLSCARGCLHSIHMFGACLWSAARQATPQQLLYPHQLLALHTAG
jgi:hypothetical protein